MTKKIALAVLMVSSLAMPGFAEFNLDGMTFKETVNQAAEVSALAAAAAKAIAPPSAITGLHGKAPLGHLLFCLQNHDSIDCKPQLDLPIGPYADLKSVKSQVDRSFGKRLDQSEKWELLSNTHAAGDCEDFAMTYRHRLLLAGWPSSALRIAVGKKLGQGHAILAAHAEEGWFVLDVLEHKPILLEKYSFEWESVQSEKNPEHW